MGNLLGIHNAFTKVLDPFNITKKVTGSSDPLDVYGGVTKAREEATEKEVASVKASQEQKIRDSYKQKYGIQLVGDI